MTQLCLTFDENNPIGSSRLTYKRYVSGDYYFYTSPYSRTYRFKVMGSIVYAPERLESGGRWLRYQAKEQLLLGPYVNWTLEVSELHRAFEQGVYQNRPREAVPTVEGQYLARGITETDLLYGIQMITEHRSETPHKLLQAIYGEGLRSKAGPILQTLYARRWLVDIKGSSYPTVKVDGNCIVFVKAEKMLLQNGLTLGQQEHIDYLIHLYNQKESNLRPLQIVKGIPKKSETGHIIGGRLFLIYGTRGRDDLQTNQLLWEDGRFMGKWSFRKKECEVFLDLKKLLKD